MRDADPATPAIWPSLVASGLPDPDEVRVVRLLLDRPPDPEEDEILDGTERARAARFVFPVHRRRFAAARAGLRRVLGRCLGRSPSSLAFAYSDRGRPRLAAPPEAGFDFNLAHSGDVALVALARRTVGVDVEVRREMPASLAIARRFFSPREVTALEALEGDGRERAFFQAWTRKEAVIKAVGAGLGALEETEVTLAPGQSAAVISAPGGAAAWRLFHLEPSAESVGAVAVRRAPAGEEVRLTTWAGP